MSEQTIEEQNGGEPAHLFTCLSCHVAFHTSSIQREHYRSDWHRYNLKRKVVELPPVTAEMFAAKIGQQTAKMTAPTESQASYDCACCEKQYASLNGYENHLLSKKHVVKSLEAPKPKRESQPKKQTFTSEIAAAETTDDVTAAVEKKIAQAVRLTEQDCLFCLQKSETFEESLEHMIKHHSFFIPDIEYLTNLKGLIAYIGDKISVANLCIYCNGKGKAWHSTEAARGHMIDKGHCKIEYDGDADLEYAEFYDFGGLNDDASSEEWVDLGEDQPESTEVALGRPQLFDNTNHDSIELILPNGKKAGHRAHTKVWNQHMKPLETREAILINQLVGQYKRLGWYGVEQRELQVKKRMARLQSHAAHDLKSRVAFKANSLQRFFRMQNPM